MILSEPEVTRDKTDNALCFMDDLEQQKIRKQDCHHIITVLPRKFRDELQELKKWLHVWDGTTVPGHKQCPQNQEITLKRIQKLEL